MVYFYTDAEIARWDKIVWKELSRSQRSTVKRLFVFVEAFKAFCRSTADAKEDFDELDWYDMSVGYFIGKGLPARDAFALASICRYKYQYWCE
jgi:hypothetical protein